MKKILFFGLIPAIIFLSGCGAHMRNPKDANASLVYGYFDMHEAPTNVDYVNIRQYKPKPKGDNPYHTAKGVKNMFWFDQLIPGSYQLVGFGGSSFWKNMAANYNLPDFSKNETALVISKPGLYYMGAYKYKKTGSFWKPSFTIERMTDPSEKEILTRLLPFSTGTQWEALIQKRIEALK